MISLAGHVLLCVFVCIILILRFVLVLFFRIHPLISSIKRLSITTKSLAWCDSGPCFMMGGGLDGVMESGEGESLVWRLGVCGYWVPARWLLCYLRLILSGGVEVRDGWNDVSAWWATYLAVGKWLSGGLGVSRMVTPGTFGMGS